MQWFMSFGQWIKTQRKAAGLSQERLAAKVSGLGVSVTAGYISNLEREYYKTQYGTPTKPKEQIVDALALRINGSPVFIGRDD